MVGRFLEKPIGCILGPGQYLSQNKQPEIAQKYLPKLSFAFRSQERTDLNTLKHILNNPSCLDYI